MIRYLGWIIIAAAVVINGDTNITCFTKGDSVLRITTVVRSGIIGHFANRSNGEPWSHFFDGRSIVASFAPMMRSLEDSYICQIKILIKLRPGFFSSGITTKDY